MVKNKTEQTNKQTKKPTKTKQNETKQKTLQSVTERDQRRIPNQECGDRILAVVM